eukprot:191207_1
MDQAGIDINNGNEKNTNNNKKDEGVTCIGFGNNNVDNDDQNDVNELGSFGGDKSCKKNRKRTMDQAGIDINNGNEKNTNNNKKDEGVTCIGFGNNNVDNDDQNDVNELGSFGGDKSCKKNRKRNMDQAGIDMDSEMEQKKVKLNSGNAVVAKGNEKVEK